MKKPSVFANIIDHKISNNEQVFTTFQNAARENFNNSDKVNVRKKLNEIFNSPKYVYKALIEIKTNNGIIEKTIVGMNSDEILTIDNEKIKISDILDINLKN